MKVSVNNDMFLESIILHETIVFLKFLNLEMDQCVMCFSFKLLTEVLLLLKHWVVVSQH